MVDTASQNKETEARTVIDSRYQIVREIARGGIGTVFEAKHLFTSKVVALKLLNPNQQQSAEAQARLLREAQALSKIKHPHIVDVLDAGMTRTGQVYLVTELVEGRALDGVLAARGRLEPKKALELALQLASALSAVHEHGIIHRDIKPHNVLLRGTSDGASIYVKLVDFGAAMVEAVDVKLTKAGEILGTPEYMAPEQLLGETGGTSSDIYGLGVTLYECITGAVPYSGTFGQVLLAVSNGPYPTMRKHLPDVSPELDALVARAIATKVADRFPSMAALSEAMTTQLKALAVAKPPPRPETRRAYSRAAYVTPVRLLLEGDTHCDGRTEDISEGGVLVFAERDLATGQRVRLRFAAPMSGVIVEVTATAKWAREQRGRRVTGLEFVNAPVDVIASIKQYISLIAPPASEA
ncbi:MAG TPA: serine/threonine-protein kinase [Polyangiaceae bacterium]